MKLHKSLIRDLILLQVVLLSSVSSIFAHPKPVPDINSRTGEFIKLDQNAQAVFFKGFTLELFIDHEKQKDTNNNSAAFFNELRNNFTQNYSVKLSYSNFNFDHRNFLKFRIFPYHFFW